MNKLNHPGVYIPPPLIYVACFFASVLLQKIYPLQSSWLQGVLAPMIGWVSIGCYLLLFISALQRFIISKNTLITVKPASSLQISGVYSVSRNPMYLSLLLLYSGIAVFAGNTWTFLLLPLLVIVVQQYVIRKEERYLKDAFGASYEAYMKKVRRWV